MDKKERTQIIITSVLTLIMIFAWANTIGIMKKRARPKVSPQTKVAPLIIGPSQMQPQKTKESKQEWEALKWARCPFSGKIYSGYSHGGIQTLKLDGIIWDKYAPMAVINDTVVNKGSRISGCVVIDIKEDRVILNDGTKNFELKLQ